MRFTRDMFPWSQPTSVYDPDGPRCDAVMEFCIGDVQMLVERTGVLAPHTGRDRFKCVCVTCDKVLHEATTGPTLRFEQHLEEDHGMVRDPPVRGKYDGMASHEVRGWDPDKDI